MLPALLLPLLLLAAPPLQARRHAPDLREDDPPRRHTRPAECQFGKQAKELGSTWFADLGPPFGVMYCIKCECSPVQRKRRVVAKVQCRNIKNDCPEPTCDTPVLLPGRCCKSCPGDVNSPDVLLEDSPMIVTAEEEELSMKHFGALLTGRSPLCIRRDDMSVVPVAPGVATGRFTFRRRHLYWSMLLGSSPHTRPRALLFLDKGGRLLLEHPLKKHPGMHATYEDATDKICGVWRRMPRDYKRLLREGSLYVAFVWGDDRNNSMESALSGRINRYPALASEMFSALLEPESPPPPPAGGAASGCDDLRIGRGAPGRWGAPGWWGATAVVTSAAGAAPSLHVALMYNGVFGPHEGRDAAVRILLQAPDKNLTIIDEVHIVPKPGHEVNVLEVSTPVTAAELRSLSRGRLQLTLESPGAPNLRVRGPVRQRASCELFQAPLITERLSAEVPATGFAWMYIDKDGSLVYDIQMENLNVKIPKITLVDDFGKRHSQVEILDTMTGILARPSARIFSPLYEEQLGVHISSETGPLLLRGRLMSRLLPDAVSSGPVLLRRTDAGQPASMVGMAWIAVDSLCSIHYEISVSGDSEVSWEAWLETWVMAAAVAGGAGARARPLPGADGCVLEPSDAELDALHAGAAYLDLRAPDNVTVLLRARLQQIRVPPACLPAVTWSSDNDLSPASLTPMHVNPPPDNSLTNPASCFYAGRFYEDGAQWMSSQSCNMCGCVHGSVRCDPVRCPPVSCGVPTITRTGECCPICTNTSAAEWNTSRGNVAGCYLAGQFHAAGSSWHPYLVPEGYDTCAVCTCDYTSLVVRCPRVSCPPLLCPEKEAYRPDKKACCRVCRESKDKKADDGSILRDEGKPRTAAEILAEGGCVFPDGPLPNGKEIHPSIHSHGEQKCVTCRCKDGVVTCVRTRCGRGACSRRQQNDTCCVCRERRARHHQRRLDPPPTPPSPS